MLDQKKLELFDVIKSLQDKAQDGDTWSYHTIGYHIPEDKADYDNSIVFTSGTKPSWEEVQKELPLVQKKLADTAYIAQRAAEYPPIADQLDTIFHDGVDAWKSQIQAVKDKFPKPTQ